MNRIKPYDVPHKGLRNALSQLSLLAGCTDYTDARAIEHLHKLGTDVFSILTVHAEDENSVTLAELETRCPGCASDDLDDHEKIHAIQQKLEQQLEQIYVNSKTGQDMSKEGADFYLSFSEFHSMYLEHTAEEERVTQPLLWQYFTDEELLSHCGKIMAKNPPEILLIWFRFIIPAQTHRERIALLSGFRKMADVSFFNEGMAVIKQSISVNEFDKLERELMQ